MTNRPCACDRYRPGPYDASQCRLCWLYHHDDAFRAYYDAAPRANLPQPPARTLPCLYLGSVLDRLGCPCPGKWQRRCSIHSVCTLEMCKTCPDYEPEG